MKQLNLNSYLFIVHLLFSSKMISFEDCLSVLKQKHPYFAKLTLK